MDLGRHRLDRDSPSCSPCDAVETVLPTPLRWTAVSEYRDYGKRRLLAEIRTPEEENKPLALWQTKATSILWVSASAGLSESLPTPRQGGADGKGEESGIDRMADKLPSPGWQRRIGLN